MIIRRCVLETEQGGGHFARDRIAQKILQSCFYWLTIFKDYFEWVKHCDAC